MSFNDRNFIYGEEHGIIEREFLDQGNEIKARLATTKLSPTQFDETLTRLLSYAKARIPKDYYDEDLPFGIARSALSVLNQYVSSLRKARELGLGLTIFSARPVYKLQPVYIIAKKIVDNNFTCFVATYNELLFWLKEIRNSSLLKQELDSRFNADFFFLVEIPESDDITAALRQDLLARFELRSSRYRPNIFTVNSVCQSLDDVLVNSFLGRLLLPFAALNKPLVVEDLGYLDVLHKRKWALLND